MPPSSSSHDDYDSRLAAEVKRYKDLVNVHDLPDIHHYWANKFLLPMIQEAGFSSPDDLFATVFRATIDACPDRPRRMLSIGAGNCDTEARIAARLQADGLADFVIACLELNPHAIARGREAAEATGVVENLSFLEGDFNTWTCSEDYAAVMANQALHHVSNLEGLFTEVQKAIGPNGVFIISDMIGRNGHQRWPEALERVLKLWKELPDTYKYNHQSKRFEDPYVNHDCATEGFEGIRAQDILPLLDEMFEFHTFIPFGNVIDIFIDRSFGHNFDPSREWDCSFIDRVHQSDEEGLASGALTPTHLMAVVGSSPVARPFYSRGLTPEQCIRVDELSSGHACLSSQIPG